MKDILPLFGLPADAPVEPLGSGHIHKTYKVLAQPPFVLQRVNKNIFKQPDIIASNLRAAANFLKKNHPSYQFLTGIKALNGAEMVYDEEGFPWRLFPFSEGTITVDAVDTIQRSRRAAAAFGRLTGFLDQVEVTLFNETIPRFHDLRLRYQQFTDALAAASPERKKAASELAARCIDNKKLVTDFESLTGEGSLRLRITHNDTKINNVLFDQDSGEAVMVIDLDTLMPGYFIYDLGDMVRTFVSPVSEEEKDFAKITFRRDIYDALLSGYLSEMGSVMSEAEKKAIPFAGKMMTYIMALRFLADFLRGDTYYHTTYASQNLVRAGNQLRFLELLQTETA